MKQFLLFLFSINSLFLTAQQTITSSFIFGDSLREFKIYLPQAYIDNPSVEVPLVLNLHGYGSENWQQEFYGDFRPIADVDNFIICHPNGTFDATGTRFWNVGLFAASSSVDDVGFLSALIDTISTRYSIDDQKVFSTGMSNGGFMSYRLACDLPNKIKKIASVTGSMTPGLFANCTNTNAIPVMQIHGTADPLVPYNGNTTMVGIEKVIGYWVNQNGCDSVAVETNVSNDNTEDNSTATRYEFNSNCADNSSVVFYKVDNGGHTWPGSVFLLPNAVTNLDFSASAVIWKFFSPETQYTNVKNITKNEMDIKVYPNPSHEYIQIELTENESILSVQVYNEIGKLVLEQTTTMLKVSDLNKGVYFMKIKTDFGTYDKKFFKN